MAAKPGDRDRCPHCGVVVLFEPPALKAGAASRGGATGTALDTCYMIGGDGGGKGIATELAFCPSCGNVAITVVGRVFTAGTRGRVGPVGNAVLVYPRSRPRPIPSAVTDADPDLADDFREAVAVLQDSPKASAALSRRCLQRTLETKGGATEGDSLYKQIGEVAGAFPSDVEELMQTVRKLGNIAAHPKEAAGAILDVEDHEAEFMLEVIESLFDHYYVRPLRNRERLDAINEKLSPE